MVKDGVGRKDGGEERVAAIDGEADALSRLRACRVRDYKLGNVGALTADQRAADYPFCCIERHPLRQRRIVGNIGAERIRVGWSAAAGDDGAACILRELCSAWARRGGYRQWTAGRR